MTESIAPPDDRMLLAEPQRQSILAVFFLIIKAVRNLGIVNLGIGAVFIFSGRVPGGVLVAAPFVVIALLAIGVLSWWRYTFQVVGDELQVTKGILQTDTLSVPLDRVQSVSIEQEFLHRIVGLVRASIDTAGSSEAEFSIDAINRPVAESLQRLTAERVAVQLQSAPGEEAAELPPPLPDQTIVHLTPARLTKFALARSPWAGIAFAAPLVAIGDDIAGFFNIDLDLEDRVTDLEFSVNLILFILAIFLVGTLLSMVMSVIRELTSHWNLTLTRTATGLRRDAGLLSKTTRASSLPRLQGFSTKQSILQRLVGLQRVKLAAIGEGDIDVPAVTDAEATQIRDLVIEPKARVQSLDRRISPLDIFLAVRSALVLTLILGLALLKPFGWWGFLGLLVVPLVFVTSRRSNQKYRWGLAELGVAEHTELLGQTESHLPLHKVQSASLTQTYFQQRRGLGTVRLQSPAGSLSIGMIPLEEAKALRDYAIRVVEQNDTAWM